MEPPPPAPPELNVSRGRLGVVRVEVRVLGREVDFGEDRFARPFFAFAAGFALRTSFLVIRVMVPHSLVDLSY